MSTEIRHTPIELRSPQISHLRGTAWSTWTDLWQAGRKSWVKSQRIHRFKYIFYSYWLHQKDGRLLDLPHPLGQVGHLIGETQRNAQRQRSYGTISYAVEMQWPKVHLSVGCGSRARKSQLWTKAGLDTRTIVFGGDEWMRMSKWMDEWLWRARRSGDGSESHTRVEVRDLLGTVIIYALAVY